MIARAHALVRLLPLLLAATAAYAQDPAAGARVFNTQCRACHAAAEGARNGVGPNLWGASGRAAATLENFRYSTPMRERGDSGLAWDEPTLRAYLTEPRAIVPGGSMTYAGLRDPQRLTDLLAWLEQQK